VPGAHYNPALTLAMLMSRRLAVRDALAYWLTQLGAGLLAAASVRAIVDPTQLAITAAMTMQGFNLVAALAVELVLTCTLCYVALDVSPRNSDTVGAYHGKPAAFSVTAAALAIGAITTRAFDPAVGVHDAVLGMFSWSTLWIYLVSQLLGGIAATITFLSLPEHD
jgi:aquaporin Z